MCASVCTCVCVCMYVCLCMYVCVRMCACAGHRGQLLVASSLFFFFFSSRVSLFPCDVTSRLIGFKVLGKSLVSTSQECHYYRCVCIFYKSF